MRFKLLLIIPLVCCTIFSTAQTTIHVPADQPTIQAGIDAASNGDIVLVDNGIYEENIVFKGKAITVASLYYDDGDTNHINNTTIDGSQPLNPDSASTVSFVYGEDTTSVLMGFTITGGSGTRDSDDCLGGGIFCKYSGPKIIYNKVTGNHCIGPSNYISGGGIAVSNSNPFTAIIRKNTISGNTSEQEKGFLASGAGISVTYGSSAIVENNTIVNNQALNTGSGQSLGGGIESYLSTIIVRNNTISNNLIEASNFDWNPWGGGIFCESIRDGSSITGNLISDNSAKNLLTWPKGGGIGIYSTLGVIEIDANMIKDNMAAQGGGLSMALNHDIAITNNILMGNATTGNGSAMYLFEFDKTGSPSPRKVHEEIQPDNSLKGSTTFALINNTVYENQGSTWGGAIYYYHTADFVAFNNIISHNTSSQYGKEINLSDDVHAYMYNNALDTSRVTGGKSITGVWNILDDPIFADDSCHLSSECMCVDFGLESLIVNAVTYYALAYDYEGDARPEYGEFDIGADESPYNNVFAGIGEVKTDNKLELIIYPNPVYSYADIRYTIYDTRYSKLCIYDSHGKLIENLVDGVQEPGEYQLKWNVENLPSGIYIYRLMVGEEMLSGKLIKH